MAGITSTKISADDRNLFINAAKLAEQQRAAQKPSPAAPAGAPGGAGAYAVEQPSMGAKIKVVGVGGGGTNAINTMISSGLDSVDFVAANTDTQSLSHSLSPVTIQVGKELTKGLGAGADPDIGRDATLEDRHEIMEALTGSDMVFVTAGMGGGTGTGGASVVAQIARELGALTVGVVTKPFTFEGRRRSKQAEIGIERLREAVDTLIVIPNQRLLQMATPEMSLLEAFKLADKVLLDAVRGISDIINIPGTINVDFADVKTIMSKMGRALMGIGSAEGEGRAMKAATMAISSPLLEDMNIEGATGVLINITAAPSVGILELNEACSVIHESAHEDANIIMGTVIDDNLEDGIRVTVIATGFAVEHDTHLAPEGTLFAPPPKKILTNIRQEMSALTSRPAASTQPLSPPAAAPTPPKATPAAYAAVEQNEVLASSAPTPAGQTAEPAMSAPSSPARSAPATTAPTSPVSHGSAPPPVDTGFTKPKGGVVGSLLHKATPATEPAKPPPPPAAHPFNEGLTADIEDSIDTAMQRAAQQPPQAPAAANMARPPAASKVGGVDIEVPTFLRKPTGSPAAQKPPAPPTS